MKLLSLLLLLATSLPSLGQIWGDFSDFTYLSRARPASAAAGCGVSNLFLQTLTASVSSSASANGDFLAQKIKNNSTVPITIKRISMGTQTNNSSGPPIWTGYVRDNPDLGAGSTYGSASVTTNVMRAGSGVVDLNWADGTEPVIPALTDFYIGNSINFNGGSGNVTSGRYEAVAGGISYIDTSYHAYLNGADYGGVTTRDLADINIWACFDHTACPSSNLWSSPINQQQLTVDNSRNMTFLSGGVYGQQIRNTSSSTVLIKKVRIGVESSGVATDTRAVVTTTGNYSYGMIYGGFSDVVNIGAGSPAALRDYIFPDMLEPIIPPNTDFVIGIFPFANNQTRIELNSAGGGTSYQTTTWNYVVNGSQDTFDVQFEVWICQ